MKLHKPDLLIFSDRTDFHVEAVLKQLSSATIPLILNLDLYGESFIFEWDNILGLSCLTNNGRRIELSDIKTVWWRRPFGIAPKKPWPTASSGLNPTLGFIFGAIQTLSRSCNFINNPFNQYQADRKVYQLEIAKRVGFLVPRTLITAQQSSIRSFLSNIEPAIMKTHGGTHRARETSFIDTNYIYSPENEAEPAIFQEFIEADLEHRLIYIDGAIFGGSFDLAAYHLCSDIRTIPELYPKQTIVPNDLTDQITRYCNAFALRYAAFDIRERKGRFYFLEANTCGEWLYIDECNGWNITKAVAHSLETAHTRSDFNNYHFKLPTFADC